MKDCKNTDHSGASQTNRRPSIEKEASTNNTKPRYLRYEPDGKTPLKFIQPDEYDGVDRHLNGNQENVQYVGNSHIRIWYNTQTEGYMPHHHAAIEIISTVEGDYTVSCNNQVYHLHQGDLLIIPPHMVHRLMGSPSGARFITLFDVSPISDFVDFKVISARFVRPVYISAAKEPVLHHQMTEGLVRSAELYFAHETMWEMMIYAEILKLYGFIGKAYLSNPDNFSSKDHPHIQRNYDKFANLITLFQGLLFPVAFAYLLTHFFGADGFWISLVASEFATVLFIAIYSKAKAKRSNGEYYGFFLNRKHDAKSVFEFTITGNVDDAVNISENIQESFDDARLSVLVSMAIEDMIVHIIDINESIDLIDVIIRDNEDYILISIKYSGKGINVMEDESIESNIAILNNISQKIDYSQILGLNNIVITIE